SALRPRVLVVLRNSAPRPGILPSTGIFLMRRSSVVSMRPPMITVWPLWTVTVVLARRELMIGTVADLLMSMLELLNALFVVLMSIFTNPSGLIFGVTVMLMP